MGQRLAGVGRLEEILEFVPRAGQELIGSGRIEGDAGLQAPVVIERRVGQGHRGKEPGQRQALPGDVHVLGVLDHDRPDRPRMAQRLGALAVRLRMGSERAGDVRRSASEVDDQLPLRIEALEVVVADFRDREPVAGEDERGLEGRCGIDAERNHGVLAEPERLLASVAHQREAAMGLVDRQGLELDRLQIAVGAGSPEAELLELPGHVFGRLAMPRAAGLAPLQGIVGQKRNVRPPAPAVRRVGRAPTHIPRAVTAIPKTAKLVLRPIGRPSSARSGRGGVHSDGPP